MQRRILLGLGLATGLCLSMAARATENWTLYNHQSAPQFTTSVGAKMLADNIERETGGAIKVRLHLAGTLQIATNTITSAVSQNVIQLGDDFFFSGNVPIAAVIRLPFLVNSDEEYVKASAVLRPYVEKAYASKGVTVLASYAYPSQYLWGRKEIANLAGLRGMKMRVASPEQSEFVRRFGGTPVTIGPSEVPSALDRGVVDGLVTGTVGADLWQDQLKSGYLMGLNYNNAYFVVNTAAFNKLSPDLQAKVRKAATDAARWNEDTMRTDDIKLATSLGAAKLKVVKPSAQDIQRAVETMRPYLDEWAKERGPEAAEVLAKIRQALGR
ncbi:MAG: hypothetical protein RIS88_2336 [Pseudomonadota bacterium]|jgi:TRAP-type C4-dicarboxylate transport system substrate-binding protein